ncbi:MAG: WecB/TagA/CpsF family glycosyltransferase [Leptolyngbyaceae cyanobacterium bins.59]|nr:WecB/TagA/CpsF family glycosyltransferase [Leptolyngbyaceae cyanobacterium bins.59]
MSQIPETSFVLGVPVHLLRDYKGWLISRLQQKIGAHVVTLNAEMTMQAEQNPALAQVISQADLIIPDGSGIVFYFWLQGIQLHRCPGIELSEALIQHAGTTEKSWAVFFYGGQPGVTTQAAKRWQEAYPDLQVAGAWHGYLSVEEKAELQTTLKEKQPRIILVGLGVPRQELWIAEHRSLCPNAIWIGVGGSFDIWAGVKYRAPLWLRNIHLEWVYRLYKEPWRWRRMLALPQFAWRSIRHRLTQKQPVRQELLVKK